jgi:anti-anti-sigma regulatory factor
MSSEARASRLLSTGQCVVVTEASTLDDEAADFLVRELEFVLEHLASRLVIDMSTVQAINANGVRVLGWAKRYTELIGGDVILVGLRPEVARLLPASVRDFLLCPDVDSAVATRVAISGLDSAIVPPQPGPLTTLPRASLWA